MKKKIILATHAIHGGRQMLFGSDILNLVMNEYHIPILCTGGGSIEDI